MFSSVAKSDQELRLQFLYFFFHAKSVTTKNHQYFSSRESKLFLSRDLNVEIFFSISRKTDLLKFLICSLISSKQREQEGVIIRKILFKLRNLGFFPGKLIVKAMVALLWQLNLFLKQPAKN